ncbi:hypothetical protein QBC40DRAFT_321057, partial [Triangularia verruculosa]
SRYLTSAFTFLNISCRRRALVLLDTASTSPSQSTRYHNKLIPHFLPSTSRMTDQEVPYSAPPFDPEHLGEFYYKGLYRFRRVAPEDAGTEDERHACSWADYWFAYAMEAMKRLKGEESETSSTFDGDIPEDMGQQRQTAAEDNVEERLEELGELEAAEDNVEERLEELGELEDWVDERLDELIRSINVDSTVTSTADSTAASPAISTATPTAASTNGPSTAASTASTVGPSTAMTATSADGPSTTTTSTSVEDSISAALSSLVASVERYFASIERYLAREEGRGEMAEEGGGGEEQVQS